MAIALPLFAFGMNVSENAHLKININKTGGEKLSRNHQLCPIEAYYNEVSQYVHTTITLNIGTVDVLVINYSTGEFLEDTFNSSTTQNHIFPICNDPGLHKIIYTTEQGDVYEGVFIVK